MTQYSQTDDNKSLSESTKATSEPARRKGIIGNLKINRVVGVELIKSTIEAISWIWLAYHIVIGIQRIPSEIVGGLYSNVDGEWLMWNAQSIFRYGNVLDFSPFNAFSGMGSMYLPNLPWVVPGAFSLGFHLPQKTAYSISAVIYMIEIAGSIIILGRVIGLSRIVSNIAAQLHIVLLFPPFSFFFNAIEWYSSAPMYAHLGALLNLGMASFLTLRGPTQGARFLFNFMIIPILAVIGLISAPFTIVFLVPSYVVLALVALMSANFSRQEIAWKLGSLLFAAIIIVSIGFPEYLRSMMNTTSRMVAFQPVQWQKLTSIVAWQEYMNGVSFCRDPRLLLCSANPLSWFQVLALIGSMLLAFFSDGLKRVLGIWGVVYTTISQVHSFVWGTMWIGPFIFPSPHFVIWPSLAILALPAAAALPLLLSRLAQIIGRAYAVGLASFPHAWRHSVSTCWQDSRMQLLRFGSHLRFGLQIAAVAAAIFWIGSWLLTGSLLDLDSYVKLRESPLKSAIHLWWTVTLGFALFLTPIWIAIAAHKAVSWLIVPGAESAISVIRNHWLLIARLLGLSLVLMTIPYTVSLMQPWLKTSQKPIRQPKSGPILDHLKAEARLDIGSKFRGYTATVWTQRYEPRSSPEHLQHYINARGYFERHYGNTFTEFDLWHSNIPTFEEYGQWITKQSQIFAANLLAKHGNYRTHLLRIYDPNLEIMTSIGVRFVITDTAIENDSRLKLVVQQSAPGARSVYLYELRNPNLGTYSPTRIMVEPGGAAKIFTQLATESNELDQKVFVTAPLEGNFVPAQHSEMWLVRDGYRVIAKSAGHSLLLLPIQFSNCLTIATKSSGHGGALGRPKPRIMRANFLQTMVAFEGDLNMTIKLEFGLFGSSRCRLKDEADVRALHPD